jgi:hypothetical protein
MVKRDKGIDPTQHRLGMPFLVCRESSVSTVARRVQTSLDIFIVNASSLSPNIGTDNDDPADKVSGRGMEGSLPSCQGQNHRC